MNNSSISQPATLLLKLLMSTKTRGFRDRVRWYALKAVRRCWLRFGDPTVVYAFCGDTLRIPLSHELPFIRRRFPLYSDNLGRITAHLSQPLGMIPIIDIGANVGDTVAIIHQHARVPILCIEGEPRYTDLLRQNVASRLPHPVIEPSFLGTNTGALVAVVHCGTARLGRSASGPDAAIQTKSFEQILAEHAGFRHSRLLKIDTDGMDMNILDSAYSWICRQKPVLFFEYAPDLQHAHSGNGLEILGRLRTAGYHRVLVYENAGDYMFSAALENETLLSELHEFFSGRQSARYCDFCVFHGEDEEIAENLRQSELAFFHAARPRPS